MAQYRHLEMKKLPQRLERRKRPGFSPGIKRNPSVHGSRLKTELENTVQQQITRQRPPTVTPSLILRVKMQGGLQEDEWEKLGLNVLSSDEDRHLVLFSSSQDINDLKARLEAYERGVPVGQRNPQYAGFVSAIDEISEVKPEDRIGKQFKDEGYTSAEDFVGQNKLIIDIELWDLGSRPLREAKVEEVSEFVERNESEVLDIFIGPSITMIRLEAPEALIADLLVLEEVSLIDLPPQADLEIEELQNQTIDDIPEILTPQDDSPVIGVIDSGVNDHPLLNGVLVGSISVPDSLGVADNFGHGTRVAGISVYGDLRNQLRNESLQPGSRLCSAKVVDHHGAFPKRKLVPNQIREAIERLHHEFGARVFVISLGLKDQPYNDGKVGPWAATLDELAAELDIVILVSAGNRYPRPQERLEEALTEYPNYLIEEDNRIIEPASALNVITVGSIAHGEGLDSAAGQYVGNRPITALGQPSPFTRVGPGVGGARKPDFVDFGGTLVFDPVAGRLHDARSLPSAGVLTIHHEHFNQLFTTGSGTSYSTPLVAFKAAQILNVLPGASGNLVRALLGIAADVDLPIRDFLAPLGEKNIPRVCGNGQIELEKAAYSDNGRVVLYTEDSLPLDHFAVYEIPIPEEFQSKKGRRNIKVSLAYDPPVRHTRMDYAGVKVNFRLIRGCDPDFIFDHFRKRERAEGKFPEMEGKFNCGLKPGPTERERSSLQVASQSFNRGIAAYGDKYYLVVRCEGRWAKEFVQEQNYAVAVELSHEEEIQLYEQLRVRVRA